MKVKIYNNPPEMVAVHEIVSIDYDDRRVYVKTHENSEVFSVRFCDTELEPHEAEHLDWLDEKNEQEWLIGSKCIFGSPECFAGIDEIPF